MTDRPDWFKCYPAKLLDAIVGMPPDQAYLYMVILLRVYDSDGPCLDSVEVLRRRTGLPKKRLLAARDALLKSGKLFAQDGGLINPFARGVLIERASKIEKNSKIFEKQGQKSKKKQGATPPEREREIQTLPLRGEVAPAPRRRGQGEAIFPLPDGWTPSEDHCRYGAELQLERSDVALEAEKMRNHVQANGIHKANWNAYFRSWLFKAWEIRARDRQRQGKNSGPDFYDVAMGRSNGQRPH